MASATEYRMHLLNDDATDGQFICSFESLEEFVLMMTHATGESAVLSYIVESDVWVAGVFNEAGHQTAAYTLKG